MTPDPKDEMDEIEALLPWYAAGTLDARDAKRVDDALADRPELGHRDAIAGDDERLSGSNSVDHLCVVVAEFALGNGLGHPPTVASNATASYTRLAEHS